ncbi:MAG: alpha/beta fold hydrolase [Phycisphaerales bacterium]|jgi:hypothetical protein|nr:alpha/beta fold hydrolase [Phycisphaerales bacterium]MDP6891117.1 alpha/beta fold hydrolase [Phycisphaerales bacterium]
MTSLLAAILAVLLHTVTTPDPLAGIWTGDLVTPNGGIALRIHITPTGTNTWTGSIDTPSQGSFGIPLSSVRFDGHTARIGCATTDATWTATLGEGGKELRGTWVQRGGSFPLSCTRGPAPPEIPPALARQLIGTWEGTLDVGAVQLRLVIGLQRNSPTTIAGYLVSPDQSPDQVAIGRVDWASDRSVRILIGTVGASFDATLSTSGGTLEGMFTQGGVPFELSLLRVESASTVNRPQEPTPPFPYQVEEVTYRNEIGDVTIAGTLTVPDGEGPFPAAILITGSGGQDRNEEIFQHKPFWVIADHLTRRGIAVLRVDDRGIGGSSAGPHPGTATTFDFAGDVEAGVDFLTKRPNIGPVGLIGHSEGGIIAPIVAARSSSVAFIVLMAGTGVRGDVLLVSQNETLMRAMDADDDEVAASGRLQRALFDIVGDDALSADETEVHLRTLIEADPDFAEAPESERAAGMKQALAQLKSPWIRAFVRYNPAPTLAKVTCPVLAINGELDLQVPHTQNLDAIAAALTKGGNTDWTVRAFPGLNHLFQHSETGLVSEYGQIEETISEEVLDFIADWIAVRFLGQQGPEIRRLGARFHRVRVAA